MKTVAVVVPMSTRSELTATERVSFRHLTTYLCRHEKYLVIPQGMRLEYAGFKVKRFAGRFFGSVAAYNRLMLSRRFYESFQEYEYILVYHTDSLVFSDQLMEWCQAGYDYIGAPWLKSKSAPEEGFAAVGNGGFSLRRVASFLKVIDSRRYAIEPERYWQKYYTGKPRLVQYLNRPRQFLKHLKLFNSARWEMWRTRRNEDRFWALRAPFYVPDFKIAPVEVALRFAFECAPRFCFEQNNGVLPFGCHAWHRYDPEFWRPYLLE